MDAQQTARLLAIGFQRSRQNRARLSMKSVQRVSGRSRVSAAFIVSLMEFMAEYGIIMAELTTGGFGLLYASALNGARSLPVTKFLTEDELSGKCDDSIETELEYDRPDTEE